MPRASLFLPLLLAVLGGCGGSGGTNTPGYPPASFPVRPAPSIRADAGSIPVRMTVPPGWSTGALGLPDGRSLSAVRPEGPCFLSISLLYGYRRPSTPAAIVSSYVSQGGRWLITHVGPDIVVQSAEASSRADPGPEAVIGTAFLHQHDGTYLAVEFGAGAWPYRGESCPPQRARGLRGILTATLPGTLLTVREIPPDIDAASASGAVRAPARTPGARAASRSAPSAPAEPVVPVVSTPAPAPVRPPAPRRAAPRRHSTRTGTARRRRAPTRARARRRTSAPTTTSSTTPTSTVSTLAPTPAPAPASGG